MRFCVALSARKVSMWLILLFAIFVAPGFSDGDQSRKGKTESEKKSNVRKKNTDILFFSLFQARYTYLQQKGLIAGEIKHAAQVPF